MNYFRKTKFRESSLIFVAVLVGPMLLSNPGQSAASEIHIE
jgi:hypothetical protein